ncbi:polyphosphate kinase 2 family protein [Actinomycetaceae bacterium TAE3-ERU4]|nr:polyphosphate kinase 2 family protein [Actinomycetaceae bacterium TAE3-ERU4]
MAKKNFWGKDPREVLAIDTNFDLAAFTRDSTPGWEGDKADAETYMLSRQPFLSDLQEKLFANSKEGATDRILVVAQGLDTAGKGGLARHVMGQVDPQGVSLKAFKKPTEAERAEHFLERIKRALPQPGMIGFFDRSHYEDILVPGVNGAEEQMLLERAEEIKAFEKELISSGCRIIKVCLMVSYQEQGRRLMERLERADKHWKYSPGDLEVRAQWFKYQEIYQWTLRHTSTKDSPWLVLPADHKWYARLAVSEALTRTLEEMDLQWPRASFDVEEQKVLLSNMM